MNTADLFVGLFDELDMGGKDISPDIITGRVATMACKAAVKGNTRMSMQEMDALMDSLLKLREEDPDALSRLLDYVRSAPLYMEVAVPMKRFVLVHGGLNCFEPEKGLDEYSTDDLVWTRPGIEDRYWDDRLVILGHTPTRYFGVEKGKMLVTDTWVDIDTGAAAGGSPMLLRLEDMCPFYAEE